MGVILYEHYSISEDIFLGENSLDINTDFKRVMP